MYQGSRRYGPAPLAAISTRADEQMEAVVLTATTTMTTTTMMMMMMMMMMQKQRSWSRVSSASRGTACSSTVTSAPGNSPEREERVTCEG